MTTEKKNELITVDPTSYAVGDVVDYGEYAGQGVDDITVEETGIPFLKILQDDCKELKDGIVPKSALGKLFNTGTQEVMAEILIVPAAREQKFVEWIPRKKGGGIAGTHAANSVIVQAAVAASTVFGDYKTENGNELKETFYLYAVVLDPETQESQGVIKIPFTSVGIKVFKKRIMGRIRPTTVPGPNGSKIKPPMFAHRIVIGTVAERKGDDDYFNYTARFPVDNNVRASLMTAEHPAFQDGAELASMFADGNVKIAESQVESSDGGSAF